MHTALNASRSIQTIRDCTKMIASVPLRHWNDSLQIREMNKPGMLKDQRFIVNLKSDVEEGKFTIKLFAEMMVLNNRLRFLVKPEKQFPDVVRCEQDAFYEIESKIAKFIKDKYRVDVKIAKLDSSTDMRLAN
ncbi:hypothetical protein ACY3KV_000071 [Shigella sonnei]|uniref:Uncharacterized protein n=3 Tax=Enterobacteriaceae TaxID=543 RepID=A0A771N415_ECOLX|nr:MULTISPECIES: hypothetical protein [Enterobacteriaceae]EFB4154101.1 hypothetical protein [Escherichia coli O25:H4]EFV6265480.1 hypothetical protein [Shigella flexneri]EFZ6288459.1 hypothetical protein [Shigella boydii]EAA0592127.1 hypothetical protein [Shigella sonnei]EAA0667834.1 hypothetical protein [Shigella sonnei]